MSLHQGRISLLLVAALVVMVASGVSAATFVSFNGKFAITYPDGWEKIDFRTVDYWLQQNQASREVYNYEAVLAPSTSAPFYSAEYLILTVDTVGALNDKQIDSVKQLLSKTFGKDVKNESGEDFFAGLQADEPMYDASTKTLSVISTVSEGNAAVKKNLMVMKFYDKGIANFFFYSPDSLITRTMPEFKSIVASFTTDVQAAMPKEEVKVTEAKPDTEKSANRSWVPFAGVGVVFIILIAGAARRRRQRKNQQESQKG